MSRTRGSPRNRAQVPDAVSPRAGLTYLPND